MKQKIEKEKVLTTKDLVFKKVFASPQNNHILIGFINDILDLSVTSVIVENAYNIKAFYDTSEEPKMRYTEVDVLARTKDGSQVTIEMQVCNREWFKERALYYVTAIYGSNYGTYELEDSSKTYTASGTKYSTLRPIYGIFIMVDSLFEEDSEPVHHFGLYDIANSLLYRNSRGQELISMVFLELKKSSSMMKKEIKRWFDYFNNGKVEADAPNYLKKACEVASFRKLSKEERDMISAREKAEQDANAREAYAWYRGVEEGEEKGKALGKKEGETSIIKAMINRGKTVEEIVSLTGIAEDDIKMALE